MNNIIKCIVFLSLTILGSNIYAQEWIPYQGSYNYVQTTNVVHQQTQYYNPQPQPVLVYQYVPYFFNQPVIVEKRCLFHTSQKITYIPMVQYLYQPVVYR